MTTKKVMHLNVVNIVECRSHTRFTNFSSFTKLTRFVVFTRLARFTRFKKIHTWSGTHIPRCSCSTLLTFSSSTAVTMAWRAMGTLQRLYRSSTMLSVCCSHGAASL